MTIEKAVLIIPTFNTIDELKKLIKKIKLQTLVPDILIVDNASADGTLDYVRSNFGLKLKKKDKNHSIYSGKLNNKAVINYILENSNLGCGPGLREGQKYAYKLGYKYQILSDSDAYPESKNLIYELIKNTGKSACVPLNSKLSRYFRDGKSQKINSFQFHYLTITREMVKKIGYVSRKYFIQFDDFDYTSRLAKRFTITQLTHVKFNHAKGLSDILMAGSSRIYYYNRNVIIYYHEYKKTLTRISIVLTYCFCGLFFCKFEDIPKFEYCMFLTIYDGIIKRTGYREISNIQQEKLKRIHVKKPKRGVYLSEPSTVDLKDLNSFVFLNLEKINLLSLIYLVLRHKNVIVNNYPTKAEYLKLMFFILFNILYIYDNGKFYKFTY